MLEGQALRLMGRVGTLALALVAVLSRLAVASRHGHVEAVGVHVTVPPSSPTDTRGRPCTVETLRRSHTAAVPWHATVRDSLPRRLPCVGVWLVRLAIVALRAAGVLPDVTAVACGGQGVHSPADPSRGHASLA